MPPLLLPIHLPCRTRGRGDLLHPPALAMATIEGGRIDLSGRGPSMVATVDVTSLRTPTNNGARFDPEELGT